MSIHAGSPTYISRKLYVPPVQDVNYICAFNFLGNKILFNFKNLKLKSLLHFPFPCSSIQVKVSLQKFHGLLLALIVMCVLVIVP